MGAVAFVTVRVHVFPGFCNPLLKPPLRAVQGVLNELWVTECMKGGMKVKVTVSFSAAVTFEGVKKRLSPPPTVTGQSTADATEARARRATEYFIFFWV